MPPAEALMALGFGAARTTVVAAGLTTLVTAVVAVAFGALGLVLAAAGAATSFWIVIWIFSGLGAFLGAPLGLQATRRRHGRTVR